MKRNIKKEKQKTFFICIFMLFIIGIISYNLLSILNQIKVLNKEKEELSLILYNLKEEEKYLKIELEKLQNPDYIARYARERYLFSRDGEFNLKIE